MYLSLLQKWESMSSLEQKHYSLALSRAPRPSVDDDEIKSSHRNNIWVSSSRKRLDILRHVSLTFICICSLIDTLSRGIKLGDFESTYLERKRERESNDYTSARTSRKEQRTRNCEKLSRESRIFSPSYLSSLGYHNIRAKLQSIRHSRNNPRLADRRAECGEERQRSDEKGRYIYIYICRDNSNLFFKQKIKKEISPKFRIYPTYRAHSLSQLRDYVIQKIWSFKIVKDVPCWTTINTSEETDRRDETNLARCRAEF